MRNNKGLSVVEILIASLVFILALAGLMSSVIAVFALIEQARDRSVAVADLSSLMEQARATAFDNLAAFFPNGVTDGPGASRYYDILGGYRLPSEHITVTYPSVNSDPLEMCSILSWQDKAGRSFNISMSTYRTR